MKASVMRCQVLVFRLSLVQSIPMGAEPVWDALSVLGQVLESDLNWA